MTSSLRNIYLFNRLDDEKLAEMEAALTRRDLASGDVLFNMGDPGDALIIVESGHIAIYAPDPDNPGEEAALRLFGRDEVLGEMSLIDHQPRSLSARAEGEASIRMLDIDTFRQFLYENPAFAMGIMEGLSDRIRYTTDFLTEVREWVEKVSTGEYQDEGFTDDVRGWVQGLTDGTLDEDDIDPNQYRDETLSALAQDFATMATRVKEREEELKKQIVELKIEIDESKRKEEVDTITTSDFFMDLKNKVDDMRAAMNEDEE